MTQTATTIHSPAPRTKKGERTQAAILDTALQLFRKHGYEATTMRIIAREANVSLGSAYYYFESKDHLIQAFYARTHQDHLAASERVLAAETDLSARLLGVMRAKLDTIKHYQRFAGILFRTAADPRSPLNPFSRESLPVRRESTELFAKVIDGTHEGIPTALRRQLPNLLWIYHMGIILFWIHDTSPGCARSYRLMERTTEIVVKLILLARLAPLRPVVKAALRLLQELEDYEHWNTSTADTRLRERRR